MLVDNIDVSMTDKPQVLVNPDDTHNVPPSRSGSVVSSVCVHPGRDDISSIMMAGAAEIRSAKYESEEQVCAHDIV